MEASSTTGHCDSAHRVEAPQGLDPHATLKGKSKTTRCALRMLSALNINHVCIALCPERRAVKVSLSSGETVSQQTMTYANIDRHRLPSTACVSHICPVPRSTLWQRPQAPNLHEATRKSRPNCQVGQSTSAPASQVARAHHGFQGCESSP